MKGGQYRNNTTTSTSGIFLLSGTTTASLSPLPQWALSDPIAVAVDEVFSALHNVNLSDLFDTTQGGVKAKSYRGGDGGESSYNNTRLEWDELVEDIVVGTLVETRDISSSWKLSSIFSTTSTSPGLDLSPSINNNNNTTTSPIMSVGDACAFVHVLRLGEGILRSFAAHFNNNNNRTTFSSFSSQLSGILWERAPFTMSWLQLFPDPNRQFQSESTLRSLSESALLSMQLLQNFMKSALSSSTSQTSGLLFDPPVSPLDLTTVCTSLSLSIALHGRQLCTHHSSHLNSGDDGSDEFLTTTMRHFERSEKSIFTSITIMLPKCVHDHALTLPHKPSEDGGDLLLSSGGCISLTRSPTQLVHAVHDHSTVRRFQANAMPQTVLEALAGFPFIALMDVSVRTSSSSSTSASQNHTGSTGPVYDTVSSILASSALSLSTAATDSVPTLALRAATKVSHALLEMDIQKQIADQNNNTNYEKSAHTAGTKGWGGRALSNQHHQLQQPLRNNTSNCHLCPCNPSTCMTSTRRDFMDAIHSVFQQQKHQTQSTSDSNVVVAIVSSNQHYVLYRSLHRRLWGLLLSYPLLQKLYLTIPLLAPSSSPGVYIESENEYDDDDDEMAPSATSRARSVSLDSEAHRDNLRTRNLTDEASPDVPRSSYRDPTDRFNTCLSRQSFRSSAARQNTADNYDDDAFYTAASNDEGVFTNDASPDASPADAPFSPAPLALNDNPPRPTNSRSQTNQSTLSGITTQYAGSQQRLPSTPPSLQIRRRASSNQPPVQQQSAAKSKTGTDAVSVTPLLKKVARFVYEREPGSSDDEATRASAYTASENASAPPSPQQLAQNTPGTADLTLPDFAISPNMGSSGVTNGGGKVGVSNTAFMAYFVDYMASAPSSKIIDFHKDGGVSSSISGASPASRATSPQTVTSASSSPPLTPGTTTAPPSTTLTGRPSSVDKPIHLFPEQRLMLSSVLQSLQMFNYRYDLPFFEENVSDANENDEEGEYRDSFHPLLIKYVFRILLSPETLSRVLMSKDPTSSAVVASTLHYLSHIRSARLSCVVGTTTSSSSSFLPVSSLMSRMTELAGLSATTTTTPTPTTTAAKPLSIGETIVEELLHIVRGIDTTTDTTKTASQQQNAASTLLSSFDDDRNEYALTRILNRFSPSPLNITSSSSPSDQKKRGLLGIAALNDDYRELNGQKRLFEHSIRDHCDSLTNQLRREYTQAATTTTTSTNNANLSSLLKPPMTAVPSSSQQQQQSRPSSLFGKIKAGVRAAASATAKVAAKPVGILRRGGGGGRSRGGQSGIKLPTTGATGGGGASDADSGDDDEDYDDGDSSVWDGEDDSLFDEDDEYLGDDSRCDSNQNGALSTSDDNPLSGGDGGHTTTPPRNLTGRDLEGLGVSGQFDLSGLSGSSNVPSPGSSQQGGRSPDSSSLNLPNTKNNSRSSSWWAARQSPPSAFNIPSNTKATSTSSSGAVNSKSTLPHLLRRIAQGGVPHSNAIGESTIYFPLPSELSILASAARRGYADVVHKSGEDGNHNHHDDDVDAEDNFITHVIMSYWGAKLLRTTEAARWLLLHCIQDNPNLTELARNPVLKLHLFDMPTVSDLDEVMFWVWERLNHPTSLLPAVASLRKPTTANGFSLTPSAAVVAKFTFQIISEQAVSLIGSTLHVLLASQCTATTNDPNRPSRLPQLIKVPSTPFIVSERISILQHAQMKHAMHTVILSSKEGGRSSSSSSPSPQSVVLEPLRVASILFGISLEKLQRLDSHTVSSSSSSSAATPSSANTLLLSGTSPSVFFSASQPSVSSEMESGSHGGTESISFIATSAVSTINAIPFLFSGSSSPPSMYALLLLERLIAVGREQKTELNLSNSTTHKSSRGNCYSYTPSLMGRALAAAAPATSTTTTRGLKFHMKTVLRHQRARVKKYKVLQEKLRSQNSTSSSGAGNTASKNQPNRPPPLSGGGRFTYDDGANQHRADKHQSSSNSPKISASQVRETARIRSRSNVASAVNIGLYHALDAMTTAALHSLATICVSGRNAKRNPTQSNLGGDAQQQQRPARRNRSSSQTLVSSSVRRIVASVDDRIRNSLNSPPRCAENCPTCQALDEAAHRPSNGELWPLCANLEADSLHLSSSLAEFIRVFSGTVAETSLRQVTLITRLRSLLLLRDSASSSTTPTTTTVDPSTMAVTLFQNAMLNLESICLDQHSAGGTTSSCHTATSISTTTNCHAAHFDPLALIAAGQDEARRNAPKSAKNSSVAVVQALAGLDNCIQQFLAADTLSSASTTSSSFAATHPSSQLITFQTAALMSELKKLAIAKSVIVQEAIVRIASRVELYVKKSERDTMTSTTSNPTHPILAMLVASPTPSTSTAYPWRSDKNFNDALQLLQSNITSSPSSNMFDVDGLSTSSSLMSMSMSIISGQHRPEGTLLLPSLISGLSTLVSRLSSLDHVRTKEQYCRAALAAASVASTTSPSHSSMATPVNRNGGGPMVRLMSTTQSVKSNDIASTAPSQIAQLLYQKLLVSSPALSFVAPTPVTIGLSGTNGLWTLPTDWLLVRATRQIFSIIQNNQRRKFGDVGNNYEKKRSMSATSTQASSIRPNTAANAMIEERSRQALQLLRGPSHSDRPPTALLISKVGGLLEYFLVRTSVSQSTLRLLQQQTSSSPITIMPYESVVTSSLFQFPTPDTTIYSNEGKNKALNELQTDLLKLQTKYAPLIIKLFGGGGGGGGGVSGTSSSSDSPTAVLMGKIDGLSKIKSSILATRLAMLRSTSSIPTSQSAADDPLQLLNDPFLTPLSHSSVRARMDTFTGRYEQLFSHAMHNTLAALVETRKARQIDSMIYRLQIVLNSKQQQRRQHHHADGTTSLSHPSPALSGASHHLHLSGGGRRPSLGDASMATMSWSDGSGDRDDTIDQDTLDAAQMGTDDTLTDRSGASDEDRGMYERMGSHQHHNAHDDDSTMDHEIVGIVSKATNNNTNNHHGDGFTDLGAARGAFPQHDGSYSDMDDDNDSDDGSSSSQDDDGHNRHHNDALDGDSSNSDDNVIFGAGTRRSQSFYGNDCNVSSSAQRAHGHRSSKCHAPANALRGTAVDYRLECGSNPTSTFSNGHHHNHHNRPSSASASGGKKGGGASSHHHQSGAIPLPDMERLCTVATAMGGLVKRLEDRCASQQSLLRICIQLSHNATTSQQSSSPTSANGDELPLMSSILKETISSDQLLVMSLLNDVRQMAIRVGWPEPSRTTGVVRSSPSSKGNLRGGGSGGGSGGLNADSPSHTFLNLMNEISGGDGIASLDGSSLSFTTSYAPPDTSILRAKIILSLGRSKGLVQDALLPLLSVVSRLATLNEVYRSLNPLTAWDRVDVGTTVQEACARAEEESDTNHNPSTTIPVATKTTSSTLTPPPPPPGRRKSSVFINVDESSSSATTDAIKAHHVATMTALHEEAAKEERDLQKALQPQRYADALILLEHQQNAHYQVLQYEHHRLSRLFWSLLSWSDIVERSLGSADDGVLTASSHHDDPNAGGGGGSGFRSSQNRSKHFNFNATALVQCDTKLAEVVRCVKDDWYMRNGSSGRHNIRKKTAADYKQTSSWCDSQATLLRYSGSVIRALVSTIARLTHPLISTISGASAPHEILATLNDVTILYKKLTESPTHTQITLSYSMGSYLSSKDTASLRTTVSSANNNSIIGSQNPNHSGMGMGVRSSSSGHQAGMSVGGDLDHFEYSPDINGRGGGGGHSRHSSVTFPDSGHTPNSTSLGVSTTSPSKNNMNSGATNKKSSLSKKKSTVPSSPKGSPRMPTLQRRSERERQRLNALHEATTSVRNRKRAEIWAERNQRYIDGRLDIHLLNLVPEFTTLSKAPSAHVCASTSKSTYRRNIELTNRMRINEDHNHGYFSPDQVEQTTDALANILRGWQASSGDADDDCLPTPLSRKRKIAIPAVGADTTASLNSCPVTSTPVAVLVNVGDADDAGKLHLSKLEGSQKLLLKSICELETFRALSGDSSFACALTAYHTTLTAPTTTSTSGPSAGASSDSRNHFYALTRLLMEVRCLDLFLHATMSGTVDLVGCGRLPSDVTGAAAGIPSVVSTLAHRAAVAPDSVRGVASDFLTVFAKKFPYVVTDAKIVGGSLSVLDSLSTFGDTTSRPTSPGVTADRVPMSMSLVTASPSSPTFGTNPFFEVQQLFLSSPPLWSAAFLPGHPHESPLHCQMLPFSLRSHGRDEVRGRVRGYAQVIENCLMIAALQQPRRLLDSLKAFSMYSSFSNARSNPHYVLAQGLHPSTTGAGGVTALKLVQEISPTTYQVVQSQSDYASSSGAGGIPTTSKSQAANTILADSDDEQFIDPIDTVKRAQGLGWQRQGDGLGYLLGLKPTKLLEVMEEQRFYDSCVASVGDKGIGECLGRAVGQSTIGRASRRVHTTIGALTLTGVENLTRGEQSTFNDDVHLMLECTTALTRQNGNFSTNEGGIVMDAIGALFGAFGGYQRLMEYDYHSASISANMSTTNPRTATSVFSTHYTFNRRAVEKTSADMQPVITAMRLGFVQGVSTYLSVVSSSDIVSSETVSNCQELLRMIVLDTIKSGSSDALRFAIENWRWLLSATPTTHLPSDFSDVHLELLRLVIEGLRWTVEERVGLFSGETDNSQITVEQGEKHKHHHSTDASSAADRSPNYEYHSIHSMLISFLSELYLEPSSPLSSDARVLAILSDFGTWISDEFSARDATSLQPSSAEDANEVGGLRPKSLLSTCHSSFSELMRFASMLMCISSNVHRSTKLHHRQHVILSSSPSTSVSSPSSSYSTVGTADMHDPFTAATGAVYEGHVELQSADASIDFGKGLFRGLSLSPLCDSRTVSEVLIGNLSAFAAIATFNSPDDNGGGGSGGGRRSSSATNKAGAGGVLSSSSAASIPELVLSQVLSGSFTSAGSSFLCASQTISRHVTLPNASRIRLVARKALLEWFAKPPSWHHGDDALAAVGDGHVLCALYNQLHTEGELVAHSGIGFAPWGPTTSNPAEMLRWRRTRDLVLLDQTGLSSTTVASASPVPPSAAAVLASFYASLSLGQIGDEEPLYHSNITRSDMIVDSGLQIAQVLRRSRPLGDAHNVALLREEAATYSTGNWWWQEGGDELVASNASDGLQQNNSFAGTTPTTTSTPSTTTTALGATFINQNRRHTAFIEGGGDGSSSSSSLRRGVFARLLSPTLFHFSRSAGAKTSPHEATSEMWQSSRGSPLLRKSNNIASFSPTTTTPNQNVYYSREAEALNSQLLCTGVESRCIMVTREQSSYTAFRHTMATTTTTASSTKPSSSSSSPQQPSRLPLPEEVLTTCVFSGRRPLSWHQLLQKRRRRRVRGVLRQFRQTAIALQRASKSAVSKGRKKMGDMRRSRSRSRGDPTAEGAAASFLGLIDLQIALSTVNSSLSVHAFGSLRREEENWGKKVYTSHIEDATVSPSTPSLQVVVDATRRHTFDLIGALKLLVRHEHERLKVWALGGTAHDSYDVGKSNVSQWVVVSTLTNEVARFPSFPPLVPPFCPALSTQVGTNAAYKYNIFPHNIWLQPTTSFLASRAERLAKQYGGSSAADSEKAHIDRVKRRAALTSKGQAIPSNLAESDYDDDLLTTRKKSSKSAPLLSHGHHIREAVLGGPHPVPPPTRTFSQLVAQITIPVWHLYCRALLEECPSAIPQLPQRFPFSPVVQIAVDHAITTNHDLFMVDPLAVENYLNAETLLQVVESNGGRRGKRLLYPLRYWAPCSITLSLKLLAKPYQKRYPTITQYALASLFTADPSKLIFFMPQLLQCLSFSVDDAIDSEEINDNDDDRQLPQFDTLDISVNPTHQRNNNNHNKKKKKALTIAAFLLEQTHHSLEFCHQLLWSLNTECEDGDNPKLGPKCQALTASITSTMSESEEEFYRRQFAYIASLIAVSGSLKPVPKEKRKEQLRTLLSTQTSLYQTPCQTELLYLPTNPDQRVREMIPHTAGAMQSAAKCPILIQFKCDERDTEEIQDSSDAPLERQLRTRACIFKFGDDCRQDQLALQLAELFRRIFRDVGVPHFLFPYRVVTTAGNCGVIECVPNAMSRDQIGKLVEGSLGEYFIQRHGHPSTTTFKKARDCFVQSSASYAVVSYILNIKDRHNGNIMVDDSGNIIHIDFGFLFDLSPGGDMNFEASPFKLTSEMLRLLGDPLWDHKKVEKVSYRRKAAALQRRAGALLRGDHSNPGNAAESRKQLAATLESRSPQSPLEALACPEAYEKFVETTVRCFLAVRQYSKEICTLVELMLESGLPCFKPFKTILDLQHRLGAHLQEKEAALQMQAMIEESRDNFRTFLYDKYQNMAERIEM